MRLLAMIPAFALLGCGLLEPADPDAPAVSETAPSEEDAAAVEPVAEGAATPDPTLPPPPGVGSSLGTTIVSLGDPGEAGMWLKTPLVQSQRPGQVRYQGNSVAVTLRPLDAPVGAGSQMSLRAMQALGAPLTELVEVTVEAG